MVPSGDHAQPLQSRVGSCVRLASTQPEALQNTDRKSMESWMRYKAEWEKEVQGIVGKSIFLILNGIEVRHLALEDSEKCAVRGERNVARFGVRNICHTPRGETP